MHPVLRDKKRKRAIKAIIRSNDKTEIWLVDGSIMLIINFHSKLLIIILCLCKKSYLFL